MIFFKPKLSMLNNVNTEVLTSWKDQLLVFADETFKDIAVKMATFLDETLEQVLEAMCLI